MDDRPSRGASRRTGIEHTSPRSHRARGLGRRSLGLEVGGLRWWRCALVWCERDKTSAVHRAVRKVGAKASWTVGPSKGAHCHPWTQPTMPAIVLAAGRSSRMKIFENEGLTGWTEEEVQLLKTRSKAMLPISPEGKPFLALLLERLVGEGVDDVCVVLSSEDQTPPRNGSHRGFLKGVRGLCKADDSSRSRQAHGHSRRRSARLGGAPGMARTFSGHLQRGQPASRRGRRPAQDHQSRHAGFRPKPPRPPH